MKLICHKASYIKITTSLQLHISVSGLAILFCISSPPPCYPSSASSFLRSKSIKWLRAQVSQDCLVRDRLFTVPPVAWRRKRFVTTKSISLGFIRFFPPSHREKKKTIAIPTRSHKANSLLTTISILQTTTITRRK